MGRLQKMEMVLPAQVCTKPHAPDNQRSGKCMSHVKIFKRHPFFSRSSLPCTHKSVSLILLPTDNLFQYKSTWTENIIIIVWMLGFFKEKNLDRYCEVSLVCQLGQATPSDLTRHWSRCCYEGILQMRLTSTLRQPKQKRSA